MIAAIVTGNFTTVEELTRKTVDNIPTGCKRVDFVADSYRKASWKNSTRKVRSSGKEIMIKSSKSEIKDWQSFMKCSNDKTQIINIMFRYIQTAKVKVFIKVRTTIMYLAMVNLI